MCSENVTTIRLHEKSTKNVGRRLAVPLHQRSCKREREEHAGKANARLGGAPDLYTGGGIGQARTRLTDRFNFATYPEAVHLGFTAAPDDCILTFSTRWIAT